MSNCRGMSVQYLSDYPQRIERVHSIKLLYVAAYFSLTAIPKPRVKTVQTVCPDMHRYTPLSMEHTVRNLFIYLLSFILRTFHSSMLKCAVQVMRWRDTRAHRPAICTRNRCTHYVQSVSNRSWPKPQLS